VPATSRSVDSDVYTVLVVDPVAESARCIETALAAQDVDCIVVPDAEEALALVQRNPPALIITEIELASRSGLDLCRQIRAMKDTESIPVVIVSAHNSEIDRIVGFEMGADDYVGKPFHSRELALRVRAILRRTRKFSEPRFLKAGAIVIDHAGCCVHIKGKQVRLTAIEFKLLASLAARQGVVFSRDQLLSTVWGDDDAIEIRSVDTYLRRLRRKLGAAGDAIETVYGFGYTLKTQPM
jgi:DNA-binding response OmpR family regulator